MNLKAAVIGINWGQVHIHALRSLGVEVIGICATHEERLSQVAQEQQITFTATTAERLLDLPLDLVTIATPANTHANLLTQCRALPIICEKPLVGMEGQNPELNALPEKLWINYAFAFLDSARAIQSLRPSLGKIHHLEMHCLYDLPLTFSPAQWWLEVASHPLSFLVHRLGEPRWLAGESWRDGDRIGCRIGAIPAQLLCREASDFTGIRQSLRLHSEAGLVELSGGFDWGSPWRYAPLRLNGQPLTDGEWCAEDCWLRANVRSIGTMIRQFRGELSPREGLSLGLFTAAKALPIDQLIQRAWR